MREIDINDYDYDLPSGRIAQYPADERDKSKLLIFKGNNIGQDIFINIDEYLPPDSILVFNNTRVIRARILFQKESGANIEILCLEPLSPKDYPLSFNSKESVEWKCIVGNLKKWKHGILTTPFNYSGRKYYLSAERLQSCEEVCQIKFSWNCREISFGEVLEKAGHIPLPPYISRVDEAEDIEHGCGVAGITEGDQADQHIAGMGDAGVAHYSFDILLHQRGDALGHAAVAAQRRVLGARQRQALAEKRPGGGHGGQGQRGKKEGLVHRQGQDSRFAV